jgi:hypothetical protein
MKEIYCDVCKKKQDHPNFKCTIQLRDARRLIALQVGDRRPYGFEDYDLCADCWDNVYERLWK